MNNVGMKPSEKWKLALGVLLAMTQSHKYCDGLCFGFYWVLALGVSLFAAQGREGNTLELE